MLFYNFFFLIYLKQLSPNNMLQFKDAVSRRPESNPSRFLIDSLKHLESHCFLRLTLPTWEEGLLKNSVQGERKSRYKYVRPQWLQLC